MDICLVFKLCLKDSQNFVHGVFFQVCFFNEHFARCVQHIFCSLKSDVFDGVNDPLVDFVGKLVEIDVFNGFVLVEFAEDVNGVFRQHGSEFDVQTAFTDGEADFFGSQIDFSFLFFFVEIDAGDLCRIECSLDEEADVAGEGNDVNVFVVEFSHDVVDSASLDSDACSDGVNSFVVAFHCDFGSFSRDACNGSHFDESLGDFGDVSFEHSQQEGGRGSGKNDFRFSVDVIHSFNDRLHGVTFVEEVARDLLVFGKIEFVALFVHEQRLALPGLIDLGCNELSDAVFVFVVERIVFEFEDFACQGLAESEDGASSEVCEIDFLSDLFSFFVVRVNLLCFAECNFFVRVGQFFVGDHHSVAIDFAVSLVGVHDDVKVLVRAEDFCNDVAETFFENAHKRGVVNVFVLLKFGKSLNQACRFGFFLSHILIVLFSSVGFLALPCHVCKRNARRTRPL